MVFSQHTWRKSQSLHQGSYTFIFQYIRKDGINRLRRFDQRHITEIWPPHLANLNALSPPLPFLKLLALKHLEQEVTEKPPKVNKKLYYS